MATPQERLANALEALQAQGRHVSREALDDHFSEGDTLRPDAAFQKYRADIEALVRARYAQGQLEPDGGVIVRTADVPPR
jgi:Protein of unknown function (DUF1488)